MTDFLLKITSFRELKAMHVAVNGHQISIETEQSLLDLLQQLKLEETHYAIAVNSEVVPRSELATKRLRAGDRIELVQAVGGG